MYIYVCSHWPYPSEICLTLTSGRVSVSLYCLMEEGLCLATVLDVDCRIDHVDLLCHARESCNMTTRSRMELYILSPTLVGVVTGRALAWLVCQMDGDGIMCRVCPSGPERFVRVVSGSVGRLLRGGWHLVSRDPMMGGQYIPAQIEGHCEDISALRRFLLE